jgi:hypothetical protein
MVGRTVQPERRTDMSVKHESVKVQLTGEDGNAFNIIGRVALALRREVSPEAAEEYTRAAFDCPSYDALLVLTMGTVHVL